MFVGHVDLLQLSGVAGWAGDTDHPDAHTEITILLNGETCAQVSADKLRPDLQALGTFGDGHHGFEYVFEQPLSALKSYDIRVQFAATKELVPAGRATLQPEPLLIADRASAGHHRRLTRLQPSAPELLRARRRGDEFAEQHRPRLGCLARRHRQSDRWP